MSTDVFPQDLQTKIIFFYTRKKGVSSDYEDWYRLGNTLFV